MSLMFRDSLPKNPNIHLQEVSPAKRPPRTGPRIGPHCGPRRKTPMAAALYFMSVTYSMIRERSKEIS